MSTLIIKNVDLGQLEKQRVELNSLIDCMPTLTTSDAVMGIVAMLDHWSDQRHCELIGSIANQKAKESQQSFDFTYKVCENCGWEGIGETCQSCGFQALTDTEFVK